MTRLLQWLKIVSPGDKGQHFFNRYNPLGYIVLTFAALIAGVVEGCREFLRTYREAFRR